MNYELTIMMVHGEQDLKKNMENYHNKIIAEIVKQLPKNGLTVNYLMNLCSLSKESAYRRIRNQIPFTMEEIVVIANDLNISIDHFFELKTAYDYPFITGLNVEQDAECIYSDLLRSDIEIMEKMLVSKQMKITAALNRVPFRFLPYKSLFRLDYCNYLYSTGKISLITKYSDIVIPPDILDLHEKSVACFNRLNNITCIIDNIICSDIIEKIKYYHRSKFISTEELHNLQSELFELLEMYESLLRNGKNSSGSDYVFYYSFFRLESNIIFFEYDNDSLLQISIYPESPIVLKNNRMVNDIQKRWIDSKMRNSTLITKTNDIHQIEILREAYNRIKEL